MLTPEIVQALQDAGITLALVIVSGLIVLRIVPMIIKYLTAQDAQEARRWNDVMNNFNRLTNEQVATLKVIQQEAVKFHQAALEQADKNTAAAMHKSTEEHGMILKAIEDLKNATVRTEHKRSFVQSDRLDETVLQEPGNSSTSNEQPGAGTENPQPSRG